jgi:protein gp37
MARLGPYEVHPFADKFPLIEGSEFEDLVADIKRNGQREPVLLNHDETMLIDGRNRYRACEAAGVSPKITKLTANYTEAMILDLIVSANVERRHLDAGQLSFLALDYETAYAKVVKNGRPIGDSPTTGSEKSRANWPAEEERRSRTRAAKAVGASGRGVQRAKAVQRDAPDLAEKVRAGEIALGKADRERRQRVRAQPKPEQVNPGPAQLILRTHDGREFPYPRPKGKATFNQTPGEGISWAEWSWNPVTGCLHGCDYCYAREIATNDRFKLYYPAGFTPLFHSERLDAPRNTTIPAAHADEDAWHRVFVCSMADLYGRWVPDEWIQQVHASMLASPQWEYLLLTKFPARYVGLDIPPGAWVGTSVDEQKRVRIAENAFREIGGAAVRWLSLEPLREPLEFTDLSMFDWVVIGAQTETRQPGSIVPAFAPPFEWVARIIAQAREAGCLIHCKPNLLGRTDPQLPGMQMPDEYPSPPRMRQGDLLGTDLSANSGRD